MSKPSLIVIGGGIHFYMGYRPEQPDHDIYQELGISFCLKCRSSLS